MHESERGTTTATTTTTKDKGIKEKKRTENERCHERSLSKHQNKIKENEVQSRTILKHAGHDVGSILEAEAFWNALAPF